MKLLQVHNSHTSIDFFSAYMIVMYGKIGKDNDDYVNGQGFCCNDAPGLRSFGSGQNDNPELFQYYYHSDHLGSTGLITNLDGETVQHIEYVPFGEVFIEERNNTWNTPYLFNAKELDEETGLYYYGARYYDPRTSVWLSVDQMWEKHYAYSAYAYVLNNPLRFIDPTGMTEEERKVALETAEGLIGQAYKSALPENDRVKTGQLDCSGLVRYSMMQNSTIEEPFNSSGNGVTQIMNSSRNVNLNDIRDGDLVVIKSGNNENGHIGFVKNIVKDENGNVIQYTMLHSEIAWTNANGQSGGGSINDNSIIKVGSESGYAKSKYNHRFYQWDNPETSNNTVNTTSTYGTVSTATKSGGSLTSGQLYFEQAPPMKFSEKLMQSKIPIVNDLGRIAKAFGF